VSGVSICHFSARFANSSSLTEAAAWSFILEMGEKGINENQTENITRQSMSSQRRQKTAPFVAIKLTQANTAGMQCSADKLRPGS
jgi:hypothetical protein